jgi:hypothetical protein
MRLDHLSPACLLYFLGVCELLVPPPLNYLLPRPPRPHGAVESGEVQVRDRPHALGERREGINLGLGEGDVVADLPCGLVEEVVARVLRLRRSESSSRWSRETSHNILKFASGDGGPVGGDGDDRVLGSETPGGVPGLDIGVGGRDNSRRGIGAS